LIWLLLEYYELEPCVVAVAAWPFSPALPARRMLDVLLATNHGLDIRITEALFEDYGGYRLLMRLEDTADSVLYIRWRLLGRVIGRTRDWWLGDLEQAAQSLMSRHVHHYYTGMEHRIRRSEIAPVLVPISGIRTMPWRTPRNSQ
jgi:hypothetical protein